MSTKEIAKNALRSYFGRSFKYCSPASDAEVVSFDVFDTLIFRKVGKPEKVFDRIASEDIDFNHKRMEAERQARDRSGAEDIKLDDIYKILGESYGTEQAEELKQKEIAVETETAYANPEALRFYRYLQEMGKRIVITSDMYLPTGVIAEILNNAGYTGYERLYVSGDQGLSKRSGNLYRRLIEECGTDNILHIGDHPIADSYMAKKAGIKSFLYRRENKINVFARNKEDVEKDCKKWAKRIGIEYQPDLIVFIAKSGFLFAKPMAEYFGCGMVDISVRRPGNSGKDTIRKLVPKIPQKVLFALLKSKANYGYQEENSEREVKTGDRFDKLDWTRYRKILIVDDSTDTGYSLLAAKEAVQNVAKDSEVRTASYCVIDISSKRVSVDYSRYRNTIVVSATSRYSKEYDVFLQSLENWSRLYNINKGVKRENGETAY